MTTREAIASKNTKELEEHIRIKHGPHIICNTCNLFFQTSEELDGHLEINHSDAQKDDKNEHIEEPQVNQSELHLWS